MNKVELGDMVCDNITGFTGVVVGKAEYLTGCDQFILQPKCAGDLGKYPDANWFDVGRLRVLCKGEVSKVEVQGDKPGADYTAPIK